MRAKGLVSGDLTSITNLDVRYVILEVPAVEWARESGGGVFVVGYFAWRHLPLDQ